ncbi:DUF6415 family natural product biosynthesis protein [Streptomyces sp. NBC_01408]|uniref:DUF6415 family natural product biosynthesis protein n=1 Tax=Streptomyces sp. NBC_01408 TaxID=2903855 RepID=UPI00224DAB8C|nr:DUF6415 family natural product biosynthesis protein [Streptomyces sp. NBC_01408]MCX4692718.1 hypothetical protein [Streptomyces sp. NBC_01408]
MAASTRADLEGVTALVRATLVPFGRKPSERDIEALTGQLLDRGEELASQVAHLRRAAGALQDWELLRTGGPERGPMGAWTYARALARTVGKMIEVLTEDDDRR